MISGKIDLSGLEHLQAKLRGVVDLDRRANVKPVLDALGALIVEDNRAGVMAGKDKDGNPMPPLRYRDGKGRATKYRPKSFGKGRRGLNEANLTAAQYRRLTGPRLAPRKGNSRVIHNLKVRKAIREKTPNGIRWIVSAAWINVVSAKGRPFLTAHFDGKGRLPKYDLRGVRPDGMREAREIWVRWAHAAIRQQMRGR
jgi:hypothetical protein